MHWITELTKKLDKEFNDYLLLIVSGLTVAAVKGLIDPQYDRIKLIQILLDNGWSMINAYNLMNTIENHLNSD